MKRYKSLLSKPIKRWKIGLKNLRKENKMQLKISEDNNNLSRKI